MLMWGSCGALVQAWAVESTRNTGDTGSTPGPGGPPCHGAAKAAGPKSQARVPGACAPHQRSRAEEQGRGDWRAAPTRRDSRSPQSNQGSAQPKNEDLKWEFSSVFRSLFPSKSRFFPSAQEAARRGIRVPGQQGDRWLSSCGRAEAGGPSSPGPGAFPLRVRLLDLRPEL